MKIEDASQLCRDCFQKQLKIETDFGANQEQRASDAILGHIGGMFSLNLKRLFSKAHFTFVKFVIFDCERWEHLQVPTKTKFHGTLQKVAGFTSYLTIGVFQARLLPALISVVSNLSRYRNKGIIS